jgi:type I restriction enzyme M protein
MLAPGGRAAVVVPDNVLYEGGAASEVRRRLVTDLNLHTILRLPGGLFYAHGLMANVLFFENQKPVPDGNVWVYDLRGDTRFSVKTRPIQSSDLADFVACYRSERTGDAAGAAGSWWPVRLDDVRESEGFMLDLSRPARLSAVTPARSRSSLDRLSKAIVADLQAAIDQMTGLERD